ncbi:small heat shock protein [Pisolithus microcarpus]|nr:small heat shock protein [Pisolithus microcarpus]
MSSVTRFYCDPFTEFDRLFDDAFSARFTPSSAVTETGSDRQAVVRPRMDLYENKDTNMVTAAFELPGLKSEDVSIEVHQNRLIVSGEFNKAESREESGYAVRERRQGKFSRTLQLPSGVKHEDVKAKMENGLLTVTFPKDSPEQPPHRITVS